MAQQTAIKIRRSAVAGKAPATTDLVLGELALNTNDGVLYFKKSPSGVDSIVALQQVTAGSSITVSSTGVVSLASNVTISGTLTDGAASVGTSGQVLTSTGTGVAWANVSGGGGSAPTVSDTPPGGATTGQLWWNSTSGELYIYYNSTWVRSVNSTATLPANLSLTSVSVTNSTSITTQSLVVEGIGNLLLSQDGQTLVLPDGQTPITTQNYNTLIVGAATGSFYFTSGGNIKLPPGGNIVDSNGNSLLAPYQAVSYGTVQTLTTTQQATARANIGLDDSTLYFYSYMFG